MDYSVKLLENFSLTNEAEAEDEGYTIEFGQIRIIQNLSSTLVTFIDYGVELPENFTSTSVEELLGELSCRLSIKFTPPDNYCKISELLKGGNCIIITNYMSSIEIKILDSSGTNEKCSLIIEEKSDLFTELETMID